MKIRLLATALGLSLTFSAAAQVLVVDPLTGDTWVDDRVQVYDNTWSTDREVYLDTMQDRFGYDRQWYEDALRRPGLSAGELYYACTLARQVGKTCQAVLDERRTLPAKGQGWGVLAKRYGIKPGSPEFHRLKASMQQDADRFDHHPSQAHRQAASSYHEHHEDHTYAHTSHKEDGDHDKSGKHKKNKPHKKSHDKGHGGH